VRAQAGDEFLGAGDNVVGNGGLAGAVGGPVALERFPNPGKERAAGEQRVLARRGDAPDRPG
jgi:hypothetical protein